MPPPPRSVDARQERTIWLGVEVGGTNVRAGCVDGDGHLISWVSYPHRLKRGEPEVLAEAADKALQSAQLTWAAVVAVGVAVAGLVDWHSGVVIDSGNLGWRDFALGRELARRFGLPVMIENDVCAAAAAEMAGMPVTTAPWLYVSVGTGVGACAVLSARLDDVLCLNVGHMPVPGASAPCACGRHGCLETLASGAAFTRAARTRIADHPEHWLFPRLAAVQGKDILGAALRGDALCTEVLAAAGAACGWAVADLVNLLTPGGVMLAGGMLGSGSPYLSALVEAARARIEPWMQDRFAFHSAQGGERAGVIGVVQLLRRRRAADRTSTGPFDASVRPGEGP